MHGFATRLENPGPPSLAHRPWQSVRLCAGKLQVRRLHKLCWPGEHDEQEDSLASFLERTTFLLDTDTVTWLLLWETSSVHMYALHGPAAQ